MENHTKSNFLKFKLGFTLSEVLITLVVIGIVAAITVPTLVHQHRNKVTATKLKHTCSVLAQMMKLAEARYGMMETWDLGEEYGGMSSDGGGNEMYNRYINTYMLPFLIGAKYEGSSMKNMGYTKSILYPNKSVYKNISSGYRFITLGNGVTLSPGIWSYGLGNNQYYVFTIRFMVDIDGPSKGPNIVGKDVFIVEQLFESGRPITMYGEIPASWDSTRKKINFGKATDRQTALKYCKQGNANSQYCGLLIKLDGWEIKPDYPW